MTRSYLVNQNFIFHYFNPGKVLVTTGYPLENGQYSEVIDLVHKNATCELLPNFPVPMYSAFGGLINNNLPVICGLPQNSIEPSCYSLGENFALTKLIEPRYDGASVVLKNEILWITGGKSKSLAGGTVKTTEFVHLNQEMADPGPDLPMLFGRHCMTKINEDLVIIIGGDYSYSETVLVEVSRNFTMKSGPQMNFDRWNHACGSFTSNGITVVIVAGGYDLSSTNLSTELWYLNPGEDWRWIEGIYF